MSIFNKFLTKPKRQEIKKFSDNEQHTSDFSPDCPAITKLKEDNELADDLDIEFEWFGLLDFFEELDAKKGKTNKYNVTVLWIDNIIKIRFDNKKNTALIIHEDLTIDWE